MKNKISLKAHNIEEYAQLTAILLLGFSSGLPFLLTLSTLSYWLAEVGISKTAIGLFMLVSLPYSLKFLWAPLIDYMAIPWLSMKMGKRRSWALMAQLALMISIIGLGQCNPRDSLLETALWAFCVSLCSATQDIIIDAYRIEVLQSKNRGFGAALETIGFRFGMLISGAGALYLASLFDWHTSYCFMAGFVVFGMMTVLWMPEPLHKTIDKPSLTPGENPRSLYNLLGHPLRQLWQTPLFLPLLLFIFCFKAGDTVLNAMSAPFLFDIGVTKVEYAHVSKLFGITLMVIGGLAGGFSIRQLGMMQSVLFCSILQGASCLMFVIQSLVGYNLSVLMITVGFESFCSGVVSAVFIAYLSSLCYQPYTATYFTLLYSFGSFSRVIISTSAGWLADYIGWTCLFLLSSMITIPCLLLILRLRSFTQDQDRHFFPKAS